MGKDRINMGKSESSSNLFQPQNLTFNSLSALLAMMVYSISIESP